MTTSVRRRGGEPLGERARLLAPARAQRPQLVGIAGVGVGVADEEEAHGCGG